MPEGIASVCVGIANEIEELEALRSGLQQELNEAAPTLKPFLLREIRQVNSNLSLLRQELHNCQAQNPPGPRPDLLALDVKRRVNHAAKTVGFAALIKNIGLGNAYGPFDIALSVSLYRGGVLINYVRVFEVPAGTTLFAEPVVEQLQPAASAAFLGARARLHVPIPSQEYITEEMVLPLYYRDDQPSARYEYEFVVDSEQQVSESNEGNNSFAGKFWTVHPQSLARTSMSVIEEKTRA